MCVSAEASFTIGAALLPAGVYCTWVSLRRKPAAVALATVPFFFSLQQISEGVAWLGLERDDPDLTRWGWLGFLFFALAFWPFWAPFTAWLLEPRRGTRWAIGGVVLLSLLWGWFLFYPLVTDPSRWLTVQAVHHSIQYRFSDLPITQIIPPI